MKVVGLISGGKDSIFNMMQCVAAGHEIVGLASLYPPKGTEIDSYMYQSVGLEVIDIISAAMGVKSYKDKIRGKAHQQGKTYEPTPDDEVEDLYNLLKYVKEQDPEIEAVSVGAILSDYQRVRIENVCIRLGLVPLAYLWQRNQEELLDEIIKCEIDAIVIKVAALGLEPKHLGRSLSLMQPHLLAMHEKYGLNVCGEGGEYETFTLDCPLFKSRVIIEDSEVVLHSNDDVCPVGYIKFNAVRTEEKYPILSLEERLAGLPLKGSEANVTDQEEGEVFDILHIGEDDQQHEVNSIPKSGVSRAFVVQNVVSARSGDNWSWIGGIQGVSRDPCEAMKDVLSKLQSALAENQQSVQDVCSISMFISDMSVFAELNKLYVEIFNYPNPPTRACIEVPLDKQCPIILEALSWSQPVIISGDAFIERHTMHVQSRSHWAPANIGPYSQSVRIGDLILLAGQIALVPGNLEMVTGGIKRQCKLALRHIGRLLRAVDSNVNVRDVVQGICYVTDIAYIEPSRKIWELKTNNAIVDYVVVSGLPRKAAVEWHVWAHRHNKEFEYEETGKCFNTYLINIYRRWNYENNIAAIVCHVDHHEQLETFDYNVFEEALKFAIQKLQQGHECDETSIYNLKIFYPVKKNIDASFLIGHLEELRQSVSIIYTVIPTVDLKSKFTYLSICGVRNQ